MEGGGRRRSGRICSLERQSITHMMAPPLLVPLHPFLMIPEGIPLPSTHPLLRPLQPSLTLMPVYLAMRLSTFRFCTTSSRVGHMQRAWGLLSLGSTLGGVGKGGGDDGAWGTCILHVV